MSDWSELTAHESVETDKMEGGNSASRCRASSHGDWAPASDRPDPVGLLEGQNEDRVRRLAPVRRGRMMVSPFTFCRGAARVMAHDLAATPLLVTLLLPVSALLLLALGGQTNAEATGITVLASAAVVVAIVVFALILRDEGLARKIGGWTDSAIKWFAGLIKRDIDVDATAGIVHFRSSIIDVVRERWLLITVANVGQQLAQFSILYLAVVALQGSWVDPIGPVEALAAFAFGRLATFIPVPPGGLGTVDALITSILQGFGLDSNSALAATMIWRAATFFPQVVIGGFTMLFTGRGRAESDPTPT